MRRSLFVLVPGRRQSRRVVDVRDEALVETPVRCSDLHRVETSRVISCLLGEDVEFGEVRFCSQFALCEAIEREGGIGLKGRRKKDSVCKRPEQSDRERGRANLSVEYFVDVWAEPNDGLFRSSYTTQRE